MTSHVFKTKVSADQTDGRVSALQSSRASSLLAPLPDDVVGPQPGVVWAPPQVVERRKRIRIQTSDQSPRARSARVHSNSRATTTTATPTSTTGHSAMIFKQFKLLFNPVKNQKT